jgi:hypothetical protein
LFVDDGVSGVAVQRGGRVCCATGSAGPSGLDANAWYLVNRMNPVVPTRAQATSERNARMAFCVFVMLLFVLSEVEGQFDVEIDIFLSLSFDFAATIMRLRSHRLDLFSGGRKHITSRNKESQPGQARENRQSPSPSYPAFRLR